MAVFAVTRVLILGGAGVFGSRLAHILDQDARIELVLGGRNYIRARKVAESLSGPARKTAAIVSAQDVGPALVKLQPDILVNCVGPFQGQDYHVAEAAIAARLPYVDLADGRTFAEGFGRLDEAAKTAGVFALTACSTTSALSSAAALALSASLSRVDGVRVGVTPGNRAPRGRAVVEAILSYVGEPVPQRRGGVDVAAPGWGRLARLELPGLGARLFSPCDAPDLPAMKMLFPMAQDIELLAGLELTILHLPLFVLARLRRMRVIPNLAAAAPFFHKAAQWFEPFGSDRGGMFVELSGLDEEGAPARRRWSLCAGSGDGPYIPAMAAAHVVKRVADGGGFAPGARMVVGEITLADFEREFAAFDIETTMEASDGADALSRPVWRTL